MDGRGLALEAVPNRRLPRPPGLSVLAIFATVDLFALVAASALTEVSKASTVLMIVLLFALNATGGHYGPRLAPAFLDEIPSLAARALAAGLIVTAFRFVVGWPVATGPLEMAAAFLVLTSAGRGIAYPLICRNGPRGVPGS